jgi:hypothetical protein
MSRLKYFRLDPRTHEVEPILDSPDEPAVLVWAESFEGRREPIASTSIPGGRVSTIFLGLDHSFGMPGEPRELFESLPFINGAGREEYMQRYATYDEALEGHAAIVAELNKGKK